MVRSNWWITAGAALVAFYLGTALRSDRVVFPDPEEARTSDELEADVARALSEPRAFARASSLIRLFEGLTKENVAGAARAVNARAGENDPVDLQMFLSAWAHLDPAAAMGEVQSWPIRSRREAGLRIVMREWAASGDTLAAGNFYETLTDAGQRNLLAGPLVRGWALSGDGPGALSLAVRFFETQARQDVVDSLVQGFLHARGPDAAIELARTLGPEAGDEFAQRVIRTTLDLAGREDPEAAAAYYDALVATAPPEPWLAPTLVQLAGLIRNTNPEAALEWLLPKAEGPERSRALMETMGTWAKRDFDAAWQWFESTGEATKDPKATLSPTESTLLAGLVRRLARLRPQEAATWAVRLRPGPDRIEMLRRVAYFWSATDSAGADEWIATLDLRPDDLNAIREAATWGRSGRGAASNVDR